MERRAFQSQELHFPLPKDGRSNGRVLCLKPTTQFRSFLNSHYVEYLLLVLVQAMCSNLDFASKGPSLSVFQASGSSQVLNQLVV